MSLFLPQFQKGYVRGYVEKELRASGAGGQKGARVVTTTARPLILQPDSTFCEEIIQAIPKYRVTTGKVQTSAKG